MANEIHFSLQHSESVVAGMAATLFAAYIQSGEVKAGSEDEYIRKATHQAIKLAAYTDKLIKSDGEWMKKNDSSAALL